MRGLENRNVGMGNVAFLAVLGLEIDRFEIPSQNEIQLENHRKCYSVSLNLCIIIVCIYYGHPNSTGCPANTSGTPPMVISILR